MKWTNLSSCIASIRAGGAMQDREDDKGYRTSPALLSGHLLTVMVKLMNSNDYVQYYHTKLTAVFIHNENNLGTEWKIQLVVQYENIKPRKTRTTYAAHCLSSFSLRG